MTVGRRGFLAWLCRPLVVLSCLIFVSAADTKSGDTIGQWSAHVGEVYTTLFSDDENCCYSIGSDGKVTSWNYIDYLNLHNFLCVWATFSLVARMLALVGMTSIINILCASGHETVHLYSGI